MTGAQRAGVLAWDEAQVAELTRLWADGIPASKIARQLGGCTRMAVIGKARRLGLESRAVAFQNRPAHGPKAAMVMAKPSIPKPLLVPAPELKAHKPVKLLKLGPHACRWPMANYDLRHGFPSCGQKTEGGVYCKAHAKAAFQSKVKA
jgi:GcrA cell cycle regulator